MLNKLASKPFTKKNVLITCGPTWVAIDDVRVISNRSTGQLGQHLAQNFKKQGAHVTLLEGPVAHPLKANGIRIIKFNFYDELKQKLHQELTKKYDVIIHAAAVSDYVPEKQHKGKIKSNLSSLSLRLRPAAKLINFIKRWQPKGFLIGFKLEENLNKSVIAKATQSLFKQAKCDLVVANSLKGSTYKGFMVIELPSANKNFKSPASVGNEGGRFKVGKKKLNNSKYKILDQANSRQELGRRLIKILETKI